MVATSQEISGSNSDLGLVVHSISGSTLNRGFLLTNNTQVAQIVDPSLAVCRMIVKSLENSTQAAQIVGSSLTASAILWEIIR